MIISVFSKDNHNNGRVFNSINITQSKSGTLAQLSYMYVYTKHSHDHTIQRSTNKNYYGKKILKIIMIIKLVKVKIKWIRFFRATMDGRWATLMDSGCPVSILLLAKCV